jgi:Ca2+-binding EF-hand superfamily protein
MADQNYDLKYSDQMKEQLRKEFDTLDINHDGFLDKDEIKKLLDK